jgi:hypothetical protein
VWLLESVLDERGDAQTGRHPAFNNKMVEEFAEGRHDRSKTREMAGTTG